jgi:eukaryotic-like serine/threonine-protein kinase
MVTAYHGTGYGNERTMEHERTTEIRPSGPPPPPWYREQWWVFLVVLLLIVGGIIAFFALRDEAGEEERTVPDVVGLQEPDARATLQDAGFSVEVVRQPAEEPEGVVFGQDPRAGTVIEKDATVTIEVSLGQEETQTDTETVTETETETQTETEPPPTTTTPDVLGAAFGDAVEQVLEAGLLPDTYPVPSPDEGGTVVAQRPDPGTSAEQGTRVRLNVSEGEGERAEAAVPDLTGPELADALRACAEAGFTCLSLDREAPSAEERGEVIDQQPAAGSGAPELTQITLFVGR